VPMSLLIKIRIKSLISIAFLAKKYTANQREV